MQFNKRSKFFFYVILFSLMIFIFVSFSLVKRLSFVSDGVSFVSQLVAKPFQFVTDSKESLGDLLVTYDENMALKRENQIVQDRESKIQDLEEENKELKDLLEMNQSYKDLNLVSAMVIDRSPSTWGQEVRVDKGSNDSVYDAMLAVGNGGLLGVVSQVNSNSSLVQLLSAKDYKQPVSVKIKAGKEEVFGLLLGYDAKKEAIILSQLNSQAKISKGDQVLTSGLGKFQVEDISVGKVLEVEENGDSLERKVYVSPNLDLKKIRSLSLVGK